MIKTLRRRMYQYPPANVVFLLLRNQDNLQDTVNFIVGFHLHGQVVVLRDNLKISEHAISFTPLDERTVSKRLLKCDSSNFAYFSNSTMSKVGSAVEMVTYEKTECMYAIEWA